MLRPGGALALWWNAGDRRVAWLREQEDRLAALTPARHRTNITERAGAMIRALDAALTPHYREVHWRRTIPLATHLTHLATHSALAVLPPDRTRAVLDAEREHLTARFPDGEVTESYVVRLTLVHRTRD